MSQTTNSKIGERLASRFGSLTTSMTDLTRNVTDAFKEVHDNVSNNHAAVQNLADNWNDFSLAVSTEPLPADVTTEVMQEKDAILLTPNTYYICGANNDFTAGVVIDPETGARIAVQTSCRDISQIQNVTMHEMCTNRGGVIRPYSNPANPNDRGLYCEATAT